MASLNKCILIGQLGRDPEVRYTDGGTAVASLSLATNEKFKNKSGEWEERTEWHRVTLWARLAEVAGEYLTQGKTIYVEGRLQTRKWQDKDGKDRFTTEVVGEKMLMLNGKGEGAGAQEGSGKGKGAGASRTSGGGNGGRAGGGGHYEEPPFNLDDEIPFLRSGFSLNPEIK